MSIHSKEVSGFYANKMICVCGDFYLKFSAFCLFVHTIEKKKKQTLINNKSVAVKFAPQKMTFEGPHRLGRRRLGFNSCR